MGITIVQKSDPSVPKRKAAKALILAGGAVTGGSFKAGGVKALNDYLVDFKVHDFDIFVGISSGSLLAAPLIGGISPESILKSLDGTSGHFTPLTAWHYYRPNFSELLSRPAGFLFQVMGWLPGGLASLARTYPKWSRGLAGAIWRFAGNPSLSSYEEIMEPLRQAVEGGDFPSILSLLPSGIFDNHPIEQYIRQNIERNRLTNDFRKTEELTGKRLYISAMRLDGARRVVFGPDEDSSMTISQAIQASTAMPGFYKPARINGIDYVDGGVQETADIDIAVRKGAQLIVCYNPFRPYEPQEFVKGFKKRGAGQALAASGILAVLNQIFRAFFHARLRVALDKFKSSTSFDGDIILIEPRADDVAFFALNPLSLSNRVRAARLGFESVRNSIEDRFEDISGILAAYGIGMTRAGVEDEFRKFSLPNVSEKDIQVLLEGRTRCKRERRGFKLGRRSRGVASKSKGRRT